MTARGFSLAFGLVIFTSASPASASYKQHMFPDVRAQQEAQSTTVSSIAEQEGDTDALEADESTMHTVLTGIAPSDVLTRATFTALVVEKMYTQMDLDRCFWDIAPQIPPTFTLVFTDVHIGDRFAKHICVAMRDGLVHGYADGSFRGDRPINLAESAKILSRAYALAPYAHLERGAPWYRAHVQALAARNAIPQSVQRLDQLMTAAQSTEMIGRIASGVTSLPSRTYEELIPRVRKPAISATPKPGTSTKPPASSSASSATRSSLRSAQQSKTASSTASVSSKTIWNPF